MTAAPGAALAIQHRLEAGGATVARAVRNVLIGGTETVILYAAATSQAAHALRDAETEVLPDVGGSWTTSRAAAHRRLGALLGYPACCIEAFVARLSRDTGRARDGRSAHEDFVAAEDSLSRAQGLFGRLNHLLFDRHLQVISFYPCRYDCPAALRVADAIVDAVEAAAPDALPRLRAGLAVVVGVWRDGRREVGAAARDADLRLDFSRF